MTISSLKDLRSAIHKENRAFASGVKESGGWNQYLRALTAQILWLGMLYVIAAKATPIKDVWFKNAALAIVVALLVLVWTAIKTKMPNWPEKLARGEYFYEFTIELLNKCIVGLMAFHATFIFAPSAVKQLKTYGQK